MRRRASSLKFMPRGIAKNPIEKSTKISDANKGKHYSIKTEFKKGIKPWSTGKHWKMSEEQKKKISQTLKGKKPANFGNGFGGKKENHYNWQGGITPISQQIRTSPEYKLWREAVFKRDNYTCIWCGLKSGNGKAVILHADHIKRFADYPELRFAIDNGRTLCIDCHKTTDTYGRRAGV